MKGYLDLGLSSSRYKCAHLFVTICIIICILLNVSHGDGSASLYLKLDMEDGDLFKRFYDFAVKNNRPYLNDSVEMTERFRIFKMTLQRAQHLNQPYDKNSRPVFGVNKFADMSPEEFKAKYLSGLTKNARPLKFEKDGILQKEHFSQVNVAALPKSVDWRERSVLSPIKDQGQCGACWAFSVTETMESMSVIQYNVTSVPALSVQESIDCNDDCKGCAGGDICQAANWSSTHGIVPERSYPLTRHTDACKAPPQSLKEVKVTDFTCQKLVNDESSILGILANHGPVAVAVDATTWHNYVEGIIRFHCSDHVNHAVQIVGYNLNGDVPYYILRNSWGSDFGDHGYLYVKYGDNLCGVASEVVKLRVSPQV